MIREPTRSHPSPASVVLRGASVVMPTEDTIIIARELGEWLHGLALVPRAGSAQPQRYTAEAARKLLDDAIAARASAEPTSPERQARRIQELDERCEVLGKLRGEALDTVSRLTQELNAADVRASERAADRADAEALAEDKTAAQASRIINLRAERTDLVEENRATKELLAEARDELDAMTAKGLEADADKLEAELTITPEEADAIGARLAARSAVAGETPACPPPDNSLEAMSYAYLATCNPSECLTITHADGEKAVTMSRDRRPLTATATPIVSPEYNE